MAETTKSSTESTEQGLMENVSSTVTGMSTAAKVTSVIGAAAAAAVAISVAVKRRRSAGKSSVFHLTPNDNGWSLELEGEDVPEARFPTKDEGLSAARELARQAAPSELVIHRTDGSEQERHQYTED